MTPVKSRNKDNDNEVTKKPAKVSHGPKKGYTTTKKKNHHKKKIHYGPVRSTVGGVKSNSQAETEVDGGNFFFLCQ